MLIWSSFFSNSNCAGLNCEESRLERSWARNASACLSVLSRGTFFFIGCNLLGIKEVRMMAAGHRRQPTLSALTRPCGPLSPRGRRQTFQIFCLPFPEEGEGPGGEGAAPTEEHLMTPAPIATRVCCARKPAPD